MHAKWFDVKSVMTRNQMLNSENQTSYCAILATLIDGMRDIANESFGGVLLQNGELDAEREEDEEADPSDNDAYDGDSEEHVQDGEVENSEPRRISFPRFSTRVVHFALYPKRKTRR